MPEYKTVEEYRDAQEKEWSQYVAVAPVQYDGVLVANVGAAIPASHPSLSSWLESGAVASTKTKAAKSAVEKGE